MDKIVGYVDVCSKDKVSGWIANLDKTGGLEKFLIWDKDGHALDFVPVLYRDDVCRHLSIKGTFGFSLYSQAMRGLTCIDKITDIYGRPLENGHNVGIKLEITSEPIFSSPLRIFLHIQKTAGTSLRSSLGDYFRNNHTLYIYPDNTTGINASQVALIPDHQKGIYKNIFGHLYFGIGNEFDVEKKYITILREPSKRLKSNYYHMIRNIPDGKDSERKKLMAKNIELGLLEEFDNYMTRIIADVDLSHVPLGNISKLHVDKAIENINNHFEFISAGVNLDDEFRDLCGLLGCKTRLLHKENVNDSYSLDIACEEINWGDLMHRNRFDVMLYNYVLQKNQYRT